jgi:ATP-dependent DNA helicase RecQ
MTSRDQLLWALKRYWGHGAFRPLQEKIVSSLLAGNDTCVVMPTGGGKSLCYQLPAALLEGKTAIVISPLIALMQDQAAQLAEYGISAGVLNSTLDTGEQNGVISRACAGEYRLLYLSPERLAREDTVEWLKRVPISFFAIDEAHCISEWGHEFRPEYRQLSQLREQFGERPIAAFTASATQRVRHDIIAQLQLRNPDKYIASFHRPNLRYVAKECDARTQGTLLLKALKRCDGSNVIVYAPTIRMVEETVITLQEHGVKALGYHGRMDWATRRSHQERWTSDEVKVLVGTIAFGLGINKAAVRAVIHLSLPKSVEQFYQEAGRAGRDGEPADCLLLWRKRDAGLLAHFIEQVTDSMERERGWQRYHEIRRFAESKTCRHLQICLHFGETPRWKNCGVCDACIGTPEWMTAASVDDTRRAGRRKHAGRGDTQHREVQSASEGKTANPIAELRNTGIKTENSSDENAQLREYLREWRRNVSKERKLAAFIVMHDTTLDDLCRRRPWSLADLLEVAGIGERKAELYGTEILRALKEFAGGARAIGSPFSVRNMQTPGKW